MEDLLSYQRMRIEALENELAKKDIELLNVNLKLAEAKKLMNEIVKAIEVEEALEV